MVNRMLVLALVLSLTLALVPRAMASKLRVGSDVAYPPFEFVDEDSGEYRGFDIDLILAIGERLGMEVEIINTAWDGIIPGLLAGEYDVIISAMTILDERAVRVDFSDPYFTTGQVIAVRAGDQRIGAPDDLAGRVVAVQIGTTGQFAAEKIEGVRRIDVYPTTPEAFLALKRGLADAVVVDELVAIEEQNANPGEIQVVGAPFTVEYYGIAIRKGRQDLLRQINRALAQIKADGTYDAIYEKWIGPR